MLTVNLIHDLNVFEKAATLLAYSTYDNGSTRGVRSPRALSLLIALGRNAEGSSTRDCTTVFHDSRYVVRAERTACTSNCSLICTAIGCRADAIPRSSFCK